MSNELGPLPEPDMSHRKALDDCDEETSYSAEAMRAYAAAEVAKERERCAKVCVERAQLSWAAADEPYAAEVKMQHESVAAAMEDLAREFRD